MGSLKYIIKDLDRQVSTVCKKFFLSTFGLEEWTVSQWANKADPGMHPSRESINEVRRGARKQL